MDGANQVNLHPDRKWRNGMSDAEMHNLYPVLLGKQMHHGFREHTGGRRAMIYTAAGYAGIQQYAATWAGDTGGADGPLISLLNHGLSGHANVSCDMEVWHPQGIHFGFLQPWSQVLSWHQYNQPWFLTENLREMFAFYARLRYRLLPYIYSAAHTAARTGLPIMRPMPQVAPDDPRSDDLLTQYMLGDAFLTAAFTPTVHLPAGRWIDYWSGAVLEGPADIEADWPADRGGPLFVRAGAIIPMWKEMDFVGRETPEVITLDIYPHGDSRFTLYEDDGVTFACEQGEIAITDISCAATPERITVRIGPRRGIYADMPAKRTFMLRLHLAAKPAAITLNRNEIRNATWDAETGILEVAAAEDPARKRDGIIEVVNTVRE
jgi:alpha-glucosidase (family GH31 glycosyl hydrolase)